MFDKFDTSILDCISTVAYIRDSDMNILYINPAAEFASGMNRTDALEKKCWQVFGNVRGRCRYNCKGGTAYESERCLNFHTVEQDACGALPVPVLVSTSQIVVDGKCEGVLVMLENNLHREPVKQGGTNLQPKPDYYTKEEQLLDHRLELNDGPVIIFQWNTGPGWPVEYVSANINKFGYSPQQFLSGQLKYEDIIHPEDRAKSRLEVERCIAEDEAFFSLEYRLCTSCGDERWVYDFSRITHSKNRDISFLNGSIIDITDRKQERKESHRNRDMLKKLLDAIPQAVFWKDLDGRYLGCNHVFAEAFGFEKAEQIIGKTDLELPIPTEVYNNYRADDKEVLETRLPKYNIIEPLHLKNGMQRWGNTSKAPLLDECGEPFAVLGIFDDITERKAMEEALEKRILALTMPLNDPEQIEFKDLFNLEELQQLQDRFCRATGVAGLLVRPDGTPLSKPSNFCKLCSETIRVNNKGKARCIASDASLGQLTPDGPVVRKCLSAGLWNGGAAITIGGRHLASWLIGQVRDEHQTEEQIRMFATEIGADQAELVRCFHDVPVMSRKQFGHVADALYTLTRYLSSLAYQNVQQARYITQRKQAEEALIENRLKLQMAHSLAKMGHWEGIMLPNSKEIIFTFNDQFYQLYATTAEKEGGYEMSARRYSEEFVHPDDRCMLSFEMDTLIARLGPDDFRQLEHRIVRRDGEVRYITVFYKLQRDGQTGSPEKLLA